MAPKSRHFLTLACCINALVLLFFIRDSRTINALDSNLGILPSAWGGQWSETDKGQTDPMKTRLKQHQCDMCSANSTLCEELGEAKLSQAIWYRGSEMRLKRFLAKAHRREGFTVGVIGGSVSAGHGLRTQVKSLGEWSERTTPSNMNRAIFDHLDSLFPAPGGQVIGEAGGNGKNGFVSGAQGGQGSEYFSMCFGEHIPEEVDLVLVDVSINDELYTKNMESYELMVRGLMDLPNKPAILNLHIFALKFRQLALGGDMHSGVNQFYDVPTISVRGPFLHDILADINLVKNLFIVTKDEHMNDIPTIENIDIRHLSVNGHRKMAELVNAYIEWQICEMGDIPKDNLDDVYPIAPLPRQLLMQNYDPDIIVPPLKPTCLSTNGVKHKLVPVENEGWENWNWKEKHYIRATKPHSKIAFNFHTSVGTVQLHYLRSAVFGLGSVKCWVDDEKDKAVTIIGYWKEKYNIGKGITIRSDLAPGDHILRCELLEATADPGGGTEFRMISVMSV